MAATCLDKDVPWTCRGAAFDNLLEDDGICLEDEPLQVNSQPLDKAAFQQEDGPLAQFAHKEKYHVAVL